ncbi:DUF2161 family putative PD-(D/E)XK-type phosphodiesterase [Peribacillus kribbensis]|uniref:DUF2161 family putative PD-(D/E)XK-type phosphodiesterase n=1 Tax=Peribacillus kribbensis TaxID=356658 RepID=UPI00041F739D|nr:DUF2161 family putative PD-(D/E)XK-type phosphodiesterase [Peribacillus kribbensis]
MNDKLFETDLYAPVRDYLSARGYDVFGEVHHCDIAAVKAGELVIVELKLTLNLELLLQAAKRLRITDQVYIAVPRKPSLIKTKKWQDLLHLIRRLEIGLILVSFLHKKAGVTIVHEPAPFDKKRSLTQNRKKKERILKEINGRNGDWNKGGSSQTSLMTAYKEASIHIAFLLNKHGILTPKALREMGTGEKTQSILYKNYYGWFERSGRGNYQISSTGRDALEEYPLQIQAFSLRED